MKIRYYVTHPTDSNCAVYRVGDDLNRLAHVVPDWEIIEDGPSKPYSTASRREAEEVARRFNYWGAAVGSYTVRT